MAHRAINVARLVTVVLLTMTRVSPDAGVARAELRAGTARIDVTNRDAGPVNDPLYVKALVLQDGDHTAAIVTIDVVALAEIGPIRNSYMGNVRAGLEKIGFPPNNILINASHCHGTVRGDVDQLTVDAIEQARDKLVPVTIGTAVGHENRIMENRRLLMKDGREVDVRHAYSLPPDDEVKEVGPIDPQIGVVRLNRADGSTLAVIYNFAVHPIQGVPSRGNTADIIGFSSGVIEDNVDGPALAFFIQGCAGDINPAYYKDVDHPRSAEPLGHLLGLSTLRALRGIEANNDNRFQFVRETMKLPRADFTQRMEDLQDLQLRLLRGLRGTSLSLKTFMPLVVKYNLSREFPSYYSHRYMHDKLLDRKDLETLDAENRSNIEQYIRNIHTMERLTRVQTNLALLKKNQAKNVAAGSRTIDVELTGIRLGEFVMVTFPGELTVRIGLNLKKASPHPMTFVAGYTNGYIYYAPTFEQARNLGAAQEDCDCLLAPEWQEQFEKKALQILQGL